MQTEIIILIMINQFLIERFSSTGKRLLRIIFNAQHDIVYSSKKRK